MNTFNDNYSRSKIMNANIVKENDPLQHEIQEAVRQGDTRKVLSNLANLMKDNIMCKCLVTLALNEDIENIIKEFVESSSKVLNTTWKVVCINNYKKAEQKKVIDGMKTDDDERNKKIQYLLQMREKFIN